MISLYYFFPYYNTPTSLVIYSTFTYQEIRAYSLNTLLDLTMVISLLSDIAN